MPEAMAGVTPPPPETVKRSRVADVSAERSRRISGGDPSEECALAEDGGVAAAVRFPAVSSKSNASGGRRPQNYRLVGETDGHTATNTHTSQILGETQYRFALQDM